MRELVGQCQRCQKDVYCTDGFLNGVVVDSGQLLCFDCEKKEPTVDSAHPPAHE